MLEVATCDAATADRFEPNRPGVLPQNVPTFGYPMRVKSGDQLWLYVDGRLALRSMFHVEMDHLVAG